MNNHQHFKQVILEACLSQSEEQFLEYRMKRCDAKAKPNSGGLIMEETHEMSNYYDGVEYEAESFNDLYDDDPFIMAAEEAVACIEACEQEEILAVPRRNDQGSDTQEIIFSTSSNSTTAEETMQDPGETSAAQDSSFEGSPTPSHQTLQLPSPSPPNSANSSPDLGQLPSSSPSMLPDLLLSTNATRNALSMFPSPRASSEVGVSLGVRQSLMCASCSFPHLNVTQTCPQLAPPEQLGHMLESTEELPDTEDNAVYEAFLRELLARRVDEVAGQTGS